MDSPEETTDKILTLMRIHGQGDYIGESISQLEHCLQCAQMARSNNSDEETVVAALLHDIGQFLPTDEVEQLGQKIRDMKASSSSVQADAPSHPDSGSVGRVGHEHIGSEYLASLNFSPKVCALVGSHVAAKRFLCATDPAYHGQLSDASKQSLKIQGGPMSGTELEDWRRGEWCDEMCRLRKWDDMAKVVGLDVDGIETYRDTLRQHLELQKPA